MNLAPSIFTETERHTVLAVARKFRIPVPPHMLSDGTGWGVGVEHEELLFLRQLVIRLLDATP